MGTGFWITQLVLMVAAIGIAVSAERRNRAEQNKPPANAPYRRIPVQTAGARRRASEFTAAEQSRLETLRRVVQQARALKTDLYDDLQPDRSDSDAGASPAWFRQHRPWTEVAVWTGVLLVAIGCIGVWHANSSLTQLEHLPTSTVVPGSLGAHLMPGVVANPGRYLTAVNSTSGSVSGNRDPIQVMAWLEQKEAVDRFEALAGAGIALVLAATAGWPRPLPATATLDQEPRGTVGSDLLPFVLIVSVFFVAMSFFELP